MASRNSTFSQLKANYLFPEIHAKVTKYLETANQGQRLIRLGIGDTTEPIPPSIAKALSMQGASLGTREGYLGYGKEQGNAELRAAISDVIYQGKVGSEDIFISDGIKCDIGRIQQLFGPSASVSVPDPAYPVYAETSIIQGQKINYLKTDPQTGYFPQLENAPKSDLIYFCSPNNPTGTCATKTQLKNLVAFAKQNGSIILFDAAYSAFIQDPNIPKSIYEIEGANQVAIEMGSFSKMAGFTGVRLGWTVVPKELCYESAHSIKSDWKRLHSTMYNGASNIAEAGGIAALSPLGQTEIKPLIAFYLNNAKILAEAAKSLPADVFGGVHAPYIWLRFKQGSSWEIFDRLLTKLAIVSTPGIGFGPSGEGSIRLSAFGSKETILEAADRLVSGAKLI